MGERSRPAANRLSGGTPRPRCAARSGQVAGLTQPRPVQRDFHVRDRLRHGSSHRPPCGWGDRSVQRIWSRPMTSARFGGTVSRVVRPWTAVVAVVAAVVQLITVPWPVSTRVVIGAALVVIAVGLLLHDLRARRQWTTPSWTAGDLHGRQFVKVSRSANIALCVFEASGDLPEHFLEVSPRKAASNESWVGTWSLAGPLLSIKVSPYTLEMGALPDGTWAGIERNAEEAEQTHEFAGAVVDERPLNGHESWTGFKLGEREGDRRVIRALANGRLEERDPFWPDRSVAVGRWSLDPDGLHISFEGRSLTMAPWQAGMYRGTERSHRPHQSVLVVRVETPPWRRDRPG